MKKIFFSIAFAIIAEFSAAQTADAHRTASAVADLLADMPAIDQARLEEHVAALGSLGEDGLVDLIARLTDYGSKDNGKLEYALGGLTYYVGRSQGRDFRDLAVRAYINSLERVRGTMDKSFIIRQLAIIGAGEAVPQIAKYCRDEQLCDAAARALASISSQEASASLLASLEGSHGKCRMAIVAALGDLRYKPAAMKIAMLAGTGDSDLQKVVLYSLSNIGDRSSLSILHDAARKVNYQYDVTDATASLLRYARRQMESGDKKMAGKIAKELFDRRETDAKVAGLNLLVDLNGRESLPLLIAALDIPSSVYRGVALKHAVAFNDESSVSRWLKEVKRGSTPNRPAIVELLGRMKAEAAQPTVYALLNDDDQATRVAAIHAAQRIAGTGSISRLLDRMKTGTDDDLAAVKAVLSRMNGDTVATRVTALLPSMPPRAKAMLNDLLRERVAKGSADVKGSVVWPEVSVDQPYTPFVLSDAEKEEGFRILFDGSNLDQWRGNKDGYVVKDGTIALEPKKGCCNLYTKEQFSDFEFRFEFRLAPGGNNGVGIRTPPEGDAAYVGMEIQILDNSAAMYKDLHEYQYHGSVYGIIPAKRGFLKPVGEWNYEQIIAKGSRIKVILNGEVIVDGDIVEASRNGTLDGREHPGLNNAKGHIGFLYHSTPIQFRNIRIKEL